MNTARHRPSPIVPSKKGLFDAWFQAAFWRLGPSAARKRLLFPPVLQAEGGTYFDQLLNILPNAPQFK